MPFVITFIHYIVLGLSLAAPVGPMNVEVIQRGLTKGLLPSWLVGLGGISGDIILLLIIYFGFADFMQLFAVKVLMYCVGVLMLTKLGINSIKSAISSNTYILNKAEERKAISKNPYLTGLLIALANPINLVFWFGVYGTSLQSLMDYSVLVSIICSFGIILGLFLWNLNVIFTVHFSKKLMNEKVIRGISFTAGLFLCGFAIHFAIQLVTILAEKL